jgi:hypothetical protein
MPRRPLTDAEHLVIAATYTWPRSGAKNLGRKCQCPDCGQSGYPGGTWAAAHSHHTTARCGKTVTQRGFYGHQARCRICIATIKETQNE